MDIGIVAMFYNGYGRFVPELCESISLMTKKPTQVTLGAFGENHGLENTDCLNLLKDIPVVKLIYYKDFKNMGSARNEVIKETPTEWIMYVDVDDIISQDAISEFEKYEEVADAIAVSYLEESDRNNSSQSIVKLSPVKLSAKDILNWRECFIVCSSPFRRCFWEGSPFLDDDEAGEYPNYPFWFSLARMGARFARTDKPCITYRYRHDGHYSKTRSDVDGYKRVLEMINKYANE